MPRITRATSNYLKKQVLTATQIAYKGIMSTKTSWSAVGRLRKNKTGDGYAGFVDLGLLGRISIRAKEQDGVLSFYAATGELPLSSQWYKDQIDDEPYEPSKEIDR